MDYYMSVESTTANFKGQGKNAIEIYIKVEKTDILTMLKDVN